MAKAIVEDKVGIRKPTPDKQVLLSILNAIASFIILVALVTYEPGTYHASPSVGSSPLLGQFGIFTARTLFGIFGLSAWLLPWFFGTFSFLLSRKILSKERFTKLTTIFLSILSISVLANIRDAQLRENGQDALLNSNIYEHGAGGSMGAILYSGMPITSNPDQQIGGFLKVWLGSLGTTVISMGMLLFALTHHFSLAPINFLLVSVEPSDSKKSALIILLTRTIRFNGESSFKRLIFNSASKAWISLRAAGEKISPEG